MKMLIEATSTIGEKITLRRLKIVEKAETQFLWILLTYGWTYRCINCCRRKNDRSS